jgi:adenylosuccinate lyase
MELSPLDGRYVKKVKELAPIFSEFGLVKYRVIVEILWLEFCTEKNLFEALPSEVKTNIENLKQNFGEKEFQKIKEIERVTNHDVKAVEYFLREIVPEKWWAAIHFACTSEDINSTAYAMMIRDGRMVLGKTLQELCLDLKEKSESWESVAMLGRTHGQPATPTTIGKEFAVFLRRTDQISKQMKGLKNFAKFSGATGNFAAHLIAFPKEKWQDLSEEFLEKKCGVTMNVCTTQIENHDGVVAVLNELSRLNSVFIDLCRDIWGYVSIGYFGQTVKKGEVGSSTMPHKVNPIDFENAEGNFKLSRGLARTLADELPISRWQRDLTDSTLQRNYGLVFGHFLLGMKSLLKGLGKLELREDVLKKDLENNPEVLTEAIQTILRKNGHHNAYEICKDLSRGKKLTLEMVQDFVKTLEIPEIDKNILINLRPEKYIGLSEEITKKVIK